jgi:mitochondrial ATPase complex subunit ATP10
MVVAVRKEQLSRPYFKDWTNTYHHDGKSFLAPPRLFKAEKALYFPNFFGQTLLKDRKPRDTTPVLQGKASVVAVFSSQWAENQVNSFISKDANPDLYRVLDDSSRKAQLVRVNVEEDSLKAWIVRLFMGNLRRRIGEPNWGNYFLVRRGITKDMRENIGLFNSKVGYTYLVDHQFRIRWAGSGPSDPEERAGLVKGLQRLVGEMTEEQTQSKVPEMASNPSSRTWSESL